MKKLALAIAFSTIAWTAPVAAQPAAEGAAPANPAMWVVKDDDTTIYLFGTFHMLDGKQDWFRGPVKAAFEGSDELVVEALIPEDTAALQPMIMQYAIDRSGRRLSDRLPGDVTTRLNRQLAAIGLPAEAVQPMKPWFVSMTLSNIGVQKLGVTPENGADMILKTAARKRGTPISELEGVEFQLKMFDDMPEAQQVSFLTQSLDSYERLGETFQPMVVAWAGGDVDGLVTIMNDSMKDQPGLYELMLSNRNATWAKWVKNRLDRPGVVFMAVGAGHLAGRDSVQELLAAKGITSTRVQ